MDALWGARPNIRPLVPLDTLAGLSNYLSPTSTPDNQPPDLATTTITPNEEEEDGEKLTEYSIFKKKQAPEKSTPIKRMLESRELIAEKRLKLDREIHREKLELKKELASMQVQNAKEIAEINTRTHQETLTMMGNIIMQIVGGTSRASSSRAGAAAIGTVIEATGGGSDTGAAQSGANSDAE